MKQNIIEQFKLPSYVKNKSFADASKAIEKRFKDRTDKHSISTKKELLERLATAQESIKQESMPQPESNDFNFGGYLQAAQGAMGMANKMFSKPQVTADSQEQSAGLAGLSGAAEGAQAGMTFGPWGAAAGAVLGGATSLFGANKANDAINDAKKTASHADFNKTMNPYAWGGSMSGDPTSMFDFAKLLQPQSSTGNLTDFMRYPTSGKTPGFNPGEENDFINSIGDLGEKPEDLSDIYKKDGSLKTDPKFFSKAGEFMKDNYADILRYAPVGANALQLASLQKPGKENLDRLDNRYDPQFVDEASLMNSINNNFNDSYLVDASGGSAGRYATNARAAQLARAKATSDAYLQREGINRGEIKTGQGFNLDIDKTNLNQSNAENQINAQNLGAYNTAKSQLTGQIGTDIGNIGREEKYKQMVKDSGLCYDSRGAYICGSGDRLTPEQVKEYTSETNENKYGGVMNSNDLFTSYVDILLNKKK
jgi:hypothetical protein